MIDPALRKTLEEVANDQVVIVRTLTGVAQQYSLQSAQIAAENTQAAAAMCKEFSRAVVSACELAKADWRHLAGFTGALPQTADGDDDSLTS